MLNLAYNLRLFKEIFFPRHCAVCGAEIDTGLVCGACRQNFALDKVRVWGATGASWQELVRQGQPLEKEDIFDRAEFLYKYDGAYKEALHKLKFEAEKDLLSLLKEETELALHVVLPKLSHHYDVVTTIPTSRERREQRGFDVPWEIFRCLAGQKQWRYSDNVLERIKQTAPLYTMGLEERQSELVGCFALADKADITGKRVLLCDDIFTTGSTMKEAGQVLLHNGAKSVGVLTFCCSKDNWDG